MNEPLDSSEGHRLRALRKSAGLTLHQASLRTGFSLSHLSNVERGERRPSDLLVHAYANLMPDTEVEKVFTDARQLDSATLGTAGSITAGSTEVLSEEDDFGTRLLRLRLARGISLGQLARETSISKSHLSNLECGRKHPSLAVATSCDKGLAAGGSLAALAFAQPAQADLPIPPPCRAATGHDRCRPSDLPPDGPVSVDDADRWLRAVRHAGQRARPGPLAVFLARQANLVAYSASACLGLRAEALWLMAARMAEFTGWLAEEAGELGSANDWTKIAAHWASLGGDRDMGGYLWERLALGALTQGDAALTIALARRGGAEPGISPRVQGLALRREAQGHALAKDRAACERALERAVMLLERGPDPYPRGASWGPNSIDDGSETIRAWCLVDIGAYPTAAALVGPDPGSQVPAGAPRTRIRFSLRGALALAYAGQLDHACAVVAAALPTIGTLGSATIRSDLTMLTAVLRRHRNYAPARVLIPEITNAARRR